MKKYMIIGGIAGLVFPFLGYAETVDLNPQKRCEKESAESGKEYFYGEGELIRFYLPEEILPTHSSPVRESPWRYGARFLMPEKEQQAYIFYIQGKWKDSSAPLESLELAPMSLEVGSLYSFCFREQAIPNSNDIAFYIDNSSTIHLIEDAK